MIKFAPLSRSFFVISIIGFIATVLYWDKLGDTWGLTLGVFFTIMFLASMVSMTYATSAADLDIGLDVKHRHRKKQKPKRKR